MSEAPNTELADLFAEFYDRYYEEEITDLAQQYPDEKRSLLIDYDTLATFHPDLADDFLTQPKQVQEYAEEALRRYETSEGKGLRQAHVRLKGLPNTVSLDAIGTRHIGQLVQTRGTIANTSKVRSEFAEIAYECQRCGTLTRIPQSTTRSRSTRDEPHECLGCERQGPFQINFDQSEMVDVQTVVLEQQIRGVGGSDDISTIEIRLEDDIAGEANPGETVLVAGVLTYTETALETTIPDKYIDALSIVDAAPNGHVTITGNDEQQIQEVAARKSLFDDITGSIAPSLYGYEEEKLAVALQLAGGVRKTLPDGSQVRGDIHLMYIGDPGTGKSILARAAARLAPRAVPVSGTETSKVGLTAAATPSSGKADPWEVKGGALVRANNGLAVIDNIDGFHEEQLAALHSTIEDQEVNVSKASVTATLPAQTAVFAAMNPEYGRFDQYQSIGEQIDLSPDIISQFDLIFTLTDQPDQERDTAVADHVLDASEVAEAEQGGTGTESPAEPVIPPELLRKYFVYAKQACVPQLTEDAKTLIRDFYVDLRAKGADEDIPVPVSARKLAAIIRLAEASARLRLSETVDEEDADRAISLVRTCLQDIGVDPETGQFDADIVETGTRERSYAGMKDWEAAKEALHTIESDYEDGIPMAVAVETITTELEVSTEKAEALVEKLQQRGEAYQPTKDRLRLT